MGFRQTLVMAVLFVALASFVYFYVVNGPGSAPTPTAAPAAQILKLDPKSIDSIQSTFEGKTVKVVRENGQWKLVEPEPAPAEQERLDDLAQRIATMTAIQTIAQNAPDLASFGLQPPQTRTVVTTTGGQSIEIHVGKESLDKASYYVKLRDSDTIYLVNTFTAGRLKGLVTEVPRAATPAAGGGTAPNVAPPATAPVLPVPGATQPAG